MAGLTCERAVALLRGLEGNKLTDLEFDEIEELLALGLAVEADPDDLTMAVWLQPLVREYARCEINSPQAISTLEARIREVEDQLKNDWFRMTTGKAERARREEDRIQMKRIVALLRDRTLVDTLTKLITNSSLLAKGAQYVACPALGSEVYALTLRGQRALRSLEVRLQRYASASLKAFLASFDKAENKMRAFSGEIATLAQNIGYVKKNREQVIIGLAKTGEPAGNALGAYHASLRAMTAPDAAVTCARNAKQFGGANYAAARLRYAQQALARAGFPASPIVMGAAKTLLAFDPPDAGIPRFKELVSAANQMFGRTEMSFKYAARLMPAHGTPAEVMARVQLAGQLLQQVPSRMRAATDIRGASVALASMVRDQNAVAPLVRRFRDIEDLLVQRGLSQPQLVEGDALECVSCPGEPAEVVDSVAILTEQIARGRAPARGDVAVAVAFAKRFSF